MFGPSRLVVGLVGLVVIGCTASQAHEVPRPLHLPVDELAARLAACKVTELATGLAMDPQVSEVWRAFPDPGVYAMLIESEDRPLEVRFAAALMLRSASAAGFKRVDPRAMAQVFSSALQEDLAGYAFPWGSLWEPHEPIGLLGEVFLELGVPAEPALGALLEDATARDTYLGRDESAAMAKRQYRVKDFAAFYLARIANLDLPWEPDLTRRDETIDQLRRQLPDLPPVGPRVRPQALTINSQPGRWSQVRTSTEREVPVCRGRIAEHR
ncbi:MAG TPA: hypothetical protein VH165_31345 [Kofleriaceae bacterium]|nr:hypothetical protein [Kofleriaceae bacterium]